MKHESTKNGKRKTMMWLLFAAPLLVPTLWFVLRYYPQTVESKLQSGNFRGELILVLSQNLRRYPYAQTFVLHDDDFLHGATTTMVYKRGSKRLSQRVFFAGPYSDIMLSNVSEESLRLAAQRFIVLNELSKTRDISNTAYDLKKVLGKYGAVAEKVPQ